MQSKFNTLMEANHSGSILWRIKLVNNSNVQQFESQSFYTGCPGYKVKVKLDLGRFMENGMRIVYLVLMLEHGQYDSSLSFPFLARCTAALVGQDMVTQVETVTVFKAHGRHSNNQQNCSTLVGRTKFFPFAKLLQRKYPASRDFLIHVEVNHVIN